MSLNFFFKFGKNLLIKKLISASPAARAVEADWMVGKESSDQKARERGLQINFDGWPWRERGHQEPCKHAT